MMIFGRTAMFRGTRRNLLPCRILLSPPSASFSNTLWLFPLLFSSLTPVLLKSVHTCLAPRFHLSASAGRWGSIASSLSLESSSFTDCFGLLCPPSASFSNTLWLFPLLVTSPTLVLLKLVLFCLKFSTVFLFDISSPLFSPMQIVMFENCPLATICSHFVCVSVETYQNRNKLNH